MNFIKSYSKQEGNVVVNLDQITKIGFIPKSGTAYSKIVFESTREYSHTWYYPDESAFQTDVKMIEGVLKMPSKKLSSLVVAGGGESNDLDEPDDSPEFF